MHLVRLLLGLLAVPPNQNKESYDPVLDWVPPSEEERTRAQRFLIEPMKALTSPVFFSTCSQTGIVYEGLSQIPSSSSQPILFVSNHQLAGFDSLMVVNELLEQCQLPILRPLTHPFLSSSGSPLPTTAFWDTFGCLPVSPRNFYRLLENQQSTLLFPGGARESFHKQAEEYTLQAWSDVGDFVRTAAKFNATIVPFSSVGAAESAVFLDSLPFANRVNAALVAAMPGSAAPYNARYDTAGGAKRINFPLVVPKPLPARHYFWFGRPIDLTLVDPRDRLHCQQLFRGIKTTIQQGCTDLVQAARTHDAYYQDPLQRLAFERLRGQQAPTFDAQLLHSRGE